jgi:hypothetical protein
MYAGVRIFIFRIHKCTFTKVGDRMFRNSVTFKNPVMKVIGNKQKKKKGKNHRSGCHLAGFVRLVSRLQCDSVLATFKGIGIAW